MTISKQRAVLWTNSEVFLVSSSNEPSPCPPFSVLYKKTHGGRFPFIAERTMETEIPPLRSFVVRLWHSENVAVAEMWVSGTVPLLKRRKSSKARAWPRCAMPSPRFSPLGQAWPCTAHTAAGRLRAHLMTLELMEGFVLLHKQVLIKAS